MIRTNRQPCQFFSAPGRQDGPGPAPRPVGVRCFLGVRCSLGLDFSQERNLKTRQARMPKHTLVMLLFYSWPTWMVCRYPYARVPLPIRCSDSTGIVIGQDAPKKIDNKTHKIGLAAGCAAASAHRPFGHLWGCGPPTRASWHAQTRTCKKKVGSEGDGSHATAGSRQRRWRSIVPACGAHLPWFPHWCILPAAVQQAVAGTALGCARRPTLHRWNTCSGVGARTGPKPFMQAS